VTTAIVPCVSGGQEEHKKVVLLLGAQASEFFFRAADEDLDQAETYPFMTPIFGLGVGAAFATIQINAIFSWSSCNARPSKVRYRKRGRL
jgi:hypothetical protein